MRLTRTSSSFWSDNNNKKVIFIQLVLRYRSSGALSVRKTKTLHIQMPAHLKYKNPARVFALSLIGFSCEKLTDKEVDFHRDEG